MRLGEGERMVNYNPPAVDDALYTTVPVTPVPEDTLDVALVVTPLPDDAAWAATRRERDALLSQSDWTQLPDVPLPTKEQWAVYRQALRDVSSEILWPEPPANVSISGN